MAIRDIIFRGKRINNGEWVEGFLVVGTDRINNGKCYILPGISDFSYGDNGNRIRIGCFVEVDPSTVGQFTGLCDKNGRKAFTADISIDSQGRKWVIFTCPGGFRTCRTAEWELMCNGILTPANVGLSDIQNAEWFENCHEVIGNVVDNPELLEGEG